MPREKGSWFFDGIFYLAALISFGRVGFHLYGHFVKGEALNWKELILQLIIGLGFLIFIFKIIPEQRARQDKT